ncbi:hypothetical protein Tco_1029588 [Tanacetum coccineum]|uniref:Uncharacterized protein n=1 Tax=Tanacetum coccineum TaxID=301880 RepID=A0ABQ5G5M7_9ASTR
MESVKKSIGERAQHKMEYERRVNERQIQTTEEKTDTSNALDALDARQQHTEQPEFINEGEADQNAEQCHDICPLPATLTDDRTTELSNQLLESENVCLKTTVAQYSEKGFAIAANKKSLRKLTGNSVNTKFAKPSILGKPVGQPLKNQSVVRQPTAFKSERPKISKPRFASQVDVNNDLSKPVTTHHFPKRRESAPAKPHNMIAPSSSRWVPTGKTFASSTTKVESEPPNGSHADITNQFESKQALNVSADYSQANRASRNFDLMITPKTFEQSSSSLGHQCIKDV